MSAAANSDAKSELIEIGPGFWNIRGHFKILAHLIDIETHMSIIRLSTGRFLVVDTIELNPKLKSQIDFLTANGTKIEAVVATHPFHTLAFNAFHEQYPNCPYYGTPRHIRKLSEKIKWAGSLDDERIRRKWEPEVEMRIPDGAEFVDPQPEKSNHFVSVFLFHRPSRTLHIDDTLLYSTKPGFLLKIAGFKDGIMAFHPAIKSTGLYPTAEAPFQFRDWMRQILIDWDFDNVCFAHMGNKLGGAKQMVEETLTKAEPLFQKLSDKNRKNNPTGAIPHHEERESMNVSGDECG